QRVAEARQAMAESAAGQLAAGMGKAAKTLLELLEAKKESVRLGAARSRLDYAVKLREPVAGGDGQRGDEVRRRAAAMAARMERLAQQPPAADPATAGDPRESPCPPT